MPRTCEFVVIAARPAVMVRWGFSAATSRKTKGAPLPDEDGLGVSLSYSRPALPPGCL